ncbi:MAG TPA: septum formation family protein [Nocardioides sp.]|nr:septum formation family protein [Nocardioides sp.]
MSTTVGLRRAAGALVAVLLLAGCTSESEPTPTPEPSPTPPPTAEPPPPGPDTGACYRLTFKQALAPTTRRKPQPCDRAHTSETYDVGRLDTLVDGHLVAVDSDRVQQQVAEDCPARLSSFLGGDLEDLRLSMVRPVWFTPTVAESDRGADWYRCDAVVVAGDSELAELDHSLAGVLGRDQDRDTYAMCGTAAPDADDFERVQCSSDHTWRAIAVVPFDPGPYPGVDAAQARGQVPCENAGLDVAADPLEFDWGYEYPTQEQWDAGQTFGRCWAPD